MFDYAAHGLIPAAVQRPIPGDGPQTVAAILVGPLQHAPDQLALVGSSGRFSYRQLDLEVRRAAAALHALGVHRFDRVAACLPNDVDIVIAFLACARLGAIWVGVNRPLAAPEKAYLLQDSGACLYLTDAAGCEEIAAQLSRLPALQHVLGVDPVNATVIADSWCEQLAAADTGLLPTVEIDPFEPVAIAYTSGTTGRPKGAVHSHHNLLLPGAVAVHEGRFGASCPQGVMLPLTILNLMVLAPLTAFQDGSCCVCMDSLKPEDIARWVRQERVGHFASVPTVIQDLLTCEAVNPDDLLTLGQPDVGGAGIAQSVQHLYQQRFGQPMTVAYGMTEAPTIATRTAPGQEPVEELCGMAVAQLDVVVVNEQDRVVPSGEIGEVCLRPTASGTYAQVYTPMLGYWNQPEATAGALANGMYHSGDLGVLDSAGQLFIRGRKKELIIRGGANIYPAEVERVLVSHAAIVDAAVLGLADERLGQRVVAVLELRESMTAPEAAALVEEVQVYCQQQLARYKVPEQFRIVSALPRNAMNKVVKPQLLDLF